MRHIKKHNEIFGIFRRKEDKDNKDSMWIINPKLELIEPGENIFKYHAEIIEDWNERSHWRSNGIRQGDVDKKFNIDNLSKKDFNKWYNSDTALWLKDSEYNRSGKMTRVSTNLKFIREGGKIYDVRKYFTELKNTSSSLGYNIGTNVYVKEFDKVGKIEELRESCLCTLNRDGDLSNLALTIYYKVRVPDESHPLGLYYNINQIQKIDHQEPLKMDPNYVSDFFIDLIDMEAIRMNIQMSQDQTGDYLFCKITILSSIHTIFNELMENYLRLSKAMESENNFYTEVNGLGRSEISFKIKQK